MTKKTVMIVDDEKLILEVLGELLESNGFNVIKAENGKDALRMLKNMKPDLILLDFFMPGMSGREVCEKIKADKKLKKLKIVFLTVARFSNKGITELKNIGILDYMQKPFENKELIKMVKKNIG